MKTVVLVFLAFVWSVAQAADTDKCLQMQNDAERWKCFDTALGFTRQEPLNPAPAEDQPKPKPFVNLMIREKGDLNNFAGAEMVDKPAQFNVQRSDGQNASIVKLGVIGAFRPVNDLGWQPFISGAWNRDTSSKKPSDVRDVNLGITGPLWDALSNSWHSTLFPTLRLTRRYDLFGDQESNRVNLHVNFVKLEWVNSPESTTDNVYSFVPHLGLASENKVVGTNKGLTRSSYAGLDFVAQLNKVLPRLSTALSLQYFADQAVPTALRKQSSRYTNFSISYALTNPEDKKITLRPSIILTREVGANLVDGAAPVNKTWLGLGLKYN